MRQKEKLIIRDLICVVLQRCSFAREEASDGRERALTCFHFPIQIIIIFLKEFNDKNGSFFAEFVVHKASVGL